MVAPVQRQSGLGREVRPDAELQFALQERGPAVRWLFPDTLRSITGRSPGIDVALDRLPVDVFLRAEVRRVGDPLYGHLRRLNGLTGAPLILIPVRVRHRPPGEEVEGEVLEPAVEIAGALIEIRSGRVLWFGIVDGGSGASDDPRALASAADALARAVVR